MAAHVTAFLALLEAGDAVILPSGSYRQLRNVFHQILPKFGILDATFNLDGPVRPEIVITDTGSYSDLVFGLFAICGYQDPA
ncbi:hypothetical protein [Streptomyces lydicus]|uniref:hypothetical protein n=1 Tax=Streptomyces lydicus TaxID=47763 RepID=UPI0036E017DB